MFTSIMDKTETYSEEQIPKSSTPWVWIGFVFAGAFFVVEIIYGVLEVMGSLSDAASLDIVLMLIAIGGWIYWLVCVYRIHKVLKELTSGRYGVSPAEAAGKHFIPILGILWLFQWPAELSDYINERGRVRMISGRLIGTMLLLSLLLRFVDGAFGTAFLFGVTMYVSAKVKKHVKTLQGARADQLPPLPDPRIFSRPLESSPTPMPEVIKEPSVG